jgi:hypothetical protein
MDLEKVERRIFLYFDGVRTVKADPLVLHRRLVAAFQGRDIGKLYESLKVAGDLAEAIEKGRTVPDSDAMQINKLASEAAQELAKGASEIFGIKSLEEDEATGLTEEERVALITSLVNYLSGVKKNTGPMPNGAEPTDSSANSATNAGSDSGSTGSVSTTRRQRRSKKD